MHKGAEGCQCKISVCPVGEHFAPSFQLWLLTAEALACAESVRLGVVLLSEALPGAQVHDGGGGAHV